LFAKMIVYGRTKGFIRIAPITALVVLSTVDLASFQLAFPHVIRTPGDLQDFIQIVRGSTLRSGLGRGVKRAINQWLNDLSEYHAIKYGSRGQTMSLRDMLRISRPVPLTERSGTLFNYLVKGLHEGNAHSIREQLPQVVAVELLKEAKLPTEQVQLIEQGRLPYEVVVGAVNKPSLPVWRSLMEQMPYFALLRNLNTLARQGVLNDAEAVRYVVGRLTNENAIRKSLVLPFRFFTAAEQLDAGVPQNVRDAVRQALEISFDNLETIPGTTLVCPDISGSMGHQLSSRGSTRYVDVACLFAAAMLKRAETPIVWPFDTQVRDIPVSKLDSLVTTTARITQRYGGGTALCAPISRAIAQGTRFDTFIGITDSEEWAGHGFLSEWKRYTRTVNPNAKAFLLQLVSNRGRFVAPESLENVWYFFGWSESVPNFIVSTIRGEKTQLDEVRALNLGGDTTGGAETDEG
jgi:60 kDa SS-A/Ro ribonucleoprotein